MIIILTVGAFIFVLAVVVLAHELGHLLAAKKAGIGVEEFGFGLGPRIFGFKYHGTQYGIYLFPIGGFVNLKGLDTELPEEKANDPENFHQKPLRKRIMTIFSGSLANLLVAVAIFWMIFSLVGVPVDLKNEVALVSLDSPAAKAGLKKGDVILAISGEKLLAMSRIIEKIHQTPAGQELVLKILRKEKVLEIKVKPIYNSQKKISLIGFIPEVINKRYGVLVSLYLALKQTGLVIINIFYSLYLILIGRLGFAGLAGPLGIAQLTGQVAQNGLFALIQFTAFISINLGVINLLPIPALDGGRLFFLFLEFVRGRPIDQKMEKYFHYIGFAFLIALVILLTFSDLRRIVAGESFFK